MILLVMGVTGSGKSTVGKALAARVGWVFVEADDYHSPEAKEKMHRGIHLTDADRLPWLDRIHARLEAENSRGKDVVLACSALKEDYRRRLFAGLRGGIVYLRGSRELIRRRIEGRTGHFAGEGILDDQFATLEEPADALVADVESPPEEIVEETIRRWRLAPAGQKQEQADELGRRTVAKLRWRLLPFLFILYVVAYLDRVNLGFAATQMKAELGLSNTAVGLGTGIFFLGYFFFQLPSNLVLERVGARRWIPALMMVWGVISASTMLVHSERSFFAARFLLGAAEAGFFPGVLYYLRRWFPPPAMAAVVALFMTAGPVSGVIGAPISGALLNLHRVAGLSGWQWMFLIEGIPAILFGGVALRFLPESPERVAWLTSEEKVWLRNHAGDLAGSARVSGTDSPRTAGWLGDPRVWAYAFIYFATNTCTYGVSLWLPSALEPFANSSTVLLGFLAAVPNFTAVVLMVLVATHSDRVGERRWHLAGAAVGGAIGLVLAGVNGAAAGSLFGFSLALAGSSSMTGPFWAMANARLSATSAARGIALINAIGNLGGGLGPYWIGALRDRTGGFRAGLLAVALLMLVASGVAIVAGRRVRNVQAGIG